MSSIDLSEKDGPQNNPVAEIFAPILGLLGITDFAAEGGRPRPVLTVGQRVVVDNPMGPTVPAGTEASVTAIVGDMGSFTAIFLDVDGFGEYAGMDIEVTPR